MRRAITISPASPSARSSASALLPRKDIAAGDVILALPSSGVHSNGFSLVRRVVEETGLRLERSRRRSRRRNRSAQALLTPTRIYVRQILETIRRTGAVKALGAYHRRRSHREYSARAARASRRRDRSRQLRPAAGLRLAAARSRARSRREMLRTFNCGIGMIVVVRRKRCDARARKHSAPKRHQIGKIVARNAGPGDALPRQA